MGSCTFLASVQLFLHDVITLTWAPWEGVGKRTYIGGHQREGLTAASHQPINFISLYSFNMDRSEAAVTIWVAIVRWRFGSPASQIPTLVMLKVSMEKCPEICICRSEKRLHNNSNREFYYPYYRHSTKYAYANGVFPLPNIILQLIYKPESI